MPLYEIDGRRPSLPDDGSAWIAPSADLIGDVRLGRSTGIWFGAVVRADNGPILIGEGSNVQEGAVLHSDPDAPLGIGRDCTIGHKAILHGCTLGDGVLIGMGATVLNHALIGDECLVGAGALVTEGKQFAAGSLIVGAPARAVRSLSAAEIADLRDSARLYVARGLVYRQNLRRCADLHAA